MPTARVDIILYIADRNDSRQISLLMNTCCEFFSWPKFLMKLVGSLFIVVLLVFRYLVKFPRYNTNQDTACLLAKREVYS